MNERGQVGRLAGRTALVTGAAQGIGAAIAAAMAREGANVWVADQNPSGASAVAAEIGGKPLIFDVTDANHWSQAAIRIADAGGGLDILVNNAGIELIRSVEDTAEDEWRRVLAVNLDGAFLGCRAMLPLLLERTRDRGLASVINISSVAGLVGFADQAAYNVSKAGLRHLAKSLAIEWAAHGHPIRVNSIVPGCIRTPMLELAVERQVRGGNLPADGAWEAVAALAPLNRVGDPDDIAMGAVYLASEESRFVTGIELVIDGGWTAR